MIAAHFLAVCEHLIEDGTTKAWSLVNLIEDVQSSLLGIPVGFNVASYWRSSDEEPGTRTFEMRVVLLDSNGRRSYESKVITARLANGSGRVRVKGILMPSSPGKYRVTVEARSTSSDDWSTSPCYWPVSFELTSDETAPHEGD